MNTVTNLNQSYPQALIQNKPAGHCHKIACSKPWPVVDNMPKTRHFRLTEAPAKPPFLSEVLELLSSHGFDEKVISIGLSGFGKIKSYLAEIGLVSTKTGFYNLHLGGNAAGTQLNRLYKLHLPEAGILNELDNLLAAFKIARKPSETFGEFAIRKQLI